MTVDKKKMVVMLTYIYVSWLVLQIFLSKFGLDLLNKATFLDSIGGTAHRPFVYRALIPAIVRSIANIIPQHIAVSFGQIFYQPEILPMAATGWGIHYVLFSLVTWGCFLGFAYAIRWLVRYFYTDYADYIVDFVAPLTALMGIPIFFRHFNFVYDPGTLVLFPLALICLLQERYLLYILVLFLCALNKETSFLLILPFLVHTRQRGMKLLPQICLFLLQFVICLGIYKYITHSFQDRPGTPLEIQLYSYNILLPVRSPFAFLWLIGVVGSIVYFISRDWKSKNSFLRFSLLLIMIPHTAILLVVGCIDEIRIFYEVYALIVLLMLPSVLRFVQVHYGSGADRLAGK